MYLRERRERERKREKEKEKEREGEREREKERGRERDLPGYPILPGRETDNCFLITLCVPLFILYNSLSLSSLTLKEKRKKNEKIKK